MSSRTNSMVIALLETRKLVREGFCLLVEEDDAAVHLAGVAGDVNELSDICEHRDVDVVIIGHVHPSVLTDTIELLRAVRVPPQIVAVGTRLPVTHVAVDATADAVAVMTLVRSSIDVRTSPRPSPASRVSAGVPLTPQQRTVLAEISDGRSTAAISQRLRVSASTVEHHKQQMYARLGVHSRAEAVAVGFRLGLLPVSVERGAEL